MLRRDRRPFIAGLIVALAVIVGVVIYVVGKPGTSTPRPVGIGTDVGHTISSDGVKLAAEVMTPAGHKAAPLVVMPAAWANPSTSYHAIATLLARAGFEVVAYGQRGFGGSTGKVDFAGAGSQRDARNVITWALRHTNADPQRIAMFGMSYGAGISLLTAAHDPRVKAVVALSTWVDLADTYDQGGTPHTAGLRSLIGSATRVPSFDSTTRHLRDTLLNSPTKLGPELRSISRDRSPASYLTQLNKNKPAIMIGNAFEDSLFAPSPLVSFFNSLKTPKRLQLAIGDHGGPERTALSGLPNDTIDDALAWLNHYVRGVDNGVDAEGPIILKDVRTGELHSFSAWPQATTGDQAPLAAPGTTAQTAADVSSRWTSTIHAGVESGATTGPMQFVPANQYTLPHVAISKINKKDAFVWNGPGLTSGLGVVGTPELKIGLASTSRTATVYLYLYDVTTDGVGALIDVQPYTATGLGAKPKQLTIPMQPIAYTVPSGDHLTFVIDTFDPSFQSLTPAGKTVTVSSTNGSPATFTAPTGL
jgi:predicted acyl esterase